MPARRSLAAGLVWLLLISLMLPGGCADRQASTSVPGGAGPEGSAGTSTSGTAADAGVVKVGALYPLSGDLAAQGEDSVRGLRLAVEEVNAGGGIHSLGGAQLVLVEGDSQGDSTVGVAEAERLVRDEGVCALIGTSQSIVALPVSEVAERLEVPFIVSMAAADSITERGLTYTFRLSPKAAWYARDQVRFLADASSLDGLVVKKVALLHEDGSFGEETAASQRKYLDDAGIEVVAEVSYSAEQADLHNEILRIRDSGAQAVLTVTYLSDALLIAQAAQVSRLGLPVFDAAGGMSDRAFIARAGADSEGMLTQLEYCPGAAPGLEKAMAEITDEALGPGAFYAYQAIWVLADALERSASTVPGRLRSALAATSMPAGEHMVLPQSLLTFDSFGQNRGARLFIVQIQNSGAVPLWPGEYRRGVFRQR